MSAFHHEWTTIWDVSAAYLGIGDGFTLLIQNHATEMSGALGGVGKSIVAMD